MKLRRPLRIGRRVARPTQTSAAEVVRRIVVSNAALVLVASPSASPAGMSCLRYEDMQARLPDVATTPRSRADAWIGWSASSHGMPGQAATSSPVGEGTAGLNSAQRVTVCVEEAWDSSQAVGLGTVLVAEGSSSNYSA